VVAILVSVFQLKVGHHRPVVVKLRSLVISVGDPDPDPQDLHVFGPPRSGCRSISQRYGSKSGSRSFSFLKGVERTEIMLAKLDFNTNFGKF
jgi:hypothetical protein